MTFKWFPTPNAISISSCYMSSSAGIGNFYKPITRLKCHQSLVTGCVFAYLNCTNTPSRPPRNSPLPGAEAWSFAKIAFDGGSSYECRAEGQPAWRQWFLLRKDYSAVW